jgi:hypothetical protein
MLVCHLSLVRFLFVGEQHAFLVVPQRQLVNLEKLSANRSFVVELVHFEVKRRKNYRIPGSKTLTFL